ncbi:hypothetical protein EVJ50_12655 [Synechococcus sp. RSCCF101]|uniref:hypothetical protein n=1 Tax=Synechococcus sp. RSCCF101 TaxID=2511069 RepID=UPI001245D6ED|nr:hypothetical protein [Synechococcus sp. RSCCF101]QEY32948.1 hypothetical protein EVJ50_12655 [Synechococcus sp. RSCCF101]
MSPSLAHHPASGHTAQTGSPGESTAVSGAAEWMETSHEQSWDSVESYFECITTCSLDDGECITRCVEELREQH